jgi:hypothetical protein
MRLLRFTRNLKLHTTSRLLSNTASHYRNSYHSGWNTQQGVGRRLLEGIFQINDARNSTGCH